MSVQPLSAEDVALLCAQPRDTQLQIGALCFFEAAPLRDARGALRTDALRSHVESRLAALPRFRQRIAPVLGDLSEPVWVDDAKFALARHTPHVELPPPGGRAALRTFMDGLLSSPMDLSHPLWDIHSVEGFDPDVVAIIVRAHHVMSDGIALHAAATLLLDDSPQSPASASDAWSPDPPVGDRRLAAISLAERARRQGSLAVETARSLLDPRRIVHNARIGTDVARIAGAARLPKRRARPLTGSVGRRRAFVWDALPMADIVAVKRACGATINDVALAIATGAVRQELVARGALHRGDPEPRALVPIGIQDSAAVMFGNRFSITTVALPVDLDDPLERVRVIHARARGQLRSPIQSLMPYLFSIADVVPPNALRALVPRVLSVQPFVDLAVSNIPGSRTPLFLRGSRMLGLSPFINVVGNIALIIGVLSYVDELGIGITVDPDVIGDPQPFLTRFRTAATELADAVR